MIPITRVEFGEDVQQKVLDVLKSGILAQGPVVAEFERLCADMASTRHAIAVNNGTTALVLALEVLNLQPGDEVITTPFTFVATLNAILETGATARFAEIGPDYNIDPDSVRNLITERTRAIVPVHLYGLTADMTALTKIAEDAGVTIVEDCAQAHFAETADGKRAGSFSLGCFSFYATKNLAAGEGGVITTDDDDLADRMRVLRNQGMRVRYQYELPGHNYRLTDLAAAVVVPQFEAIASRTEARRRNAEKLNAGLAGLPGVVLPVHRDDRKHVFHQYTIRLTKESKLNRDQLSEHLTKAEIGHGFYYPRAVYDYDCYRGHPRVVIDGSPYAEEVASSVISLPVHPFLNDAEIETITESMKLGLS